jgi:arylsulfatase A-like enzyme
MPNVQRELAAKGVTFAHAFVSNPQCCPSRVSILTGRYSHSTGVWSNVSPNGGFPAFHDDASTVATWLHAAGYRTALIGKYLNEYREAALEGYVPPGWDRWVAFAEENGQYYDYDLTVNGTLAHRGRAPRDYSTNALTNQAVDFIESARNPFFLYFAPTAPHDPYVPAPADLASCGDLRAYRPSSFGEADVSDKPGFVRELPWSAVKAGEAEDIRLGQCQTLQGIDRAVERIVAALRAKGELSSTLIVFTSDNGLMWGEHRLFYKSVPYEESIRVPMVVRYDPLTRDPRVDRRFVLNLDLAPTFAAAAGLPERSLDGRSLLPLLAGEAVPWRSTFLLEHAEGSELIPIPDYCGERTPRWMYARYRTGAEELYDLSSDPKELVNLASRESVGAVLERLRALTAKECRPLPPGFAS